jgi:hypothetical protein
MAPIFEKGKWRVVRNCCQSGNCFECRELGVGKRKIVVHTDDVSEHWAKYVAANWERYGAKAEKMPS